MEEDQDEVATARSKQWWLLNISMEAAMVGVLSELNGIFLIKRLT